jgi:hypothetical protein
LKEGLIFWVNCQQVFITHHFVIGGVMRLSFEKALAVLLLMASMAFMSNSLWAEEAVPVSSDGAEAPASDVPAILLPDLSFSILEDGRIGIVTVGFTENDISRFTFNGQDVTEVIESFKESGLIESGNVTIENEKGEVHQADNFGMKVTVEPLTLEGHMFGVVLRNGLELRKTVEFSDEKGYIGICFSERQNGTCPAGLIIISW